MFTIEVRGEGGDDLCLNGPLQWSGAEAGVETLAGQMIYQALSPHKLDAAFPQPFSRC